MEAYYLMRNFIHLVFITYILLNITRFNLHIPCILKIGMPNPKSSKKWDYEQF